MDLKIRQILIKSRILKVRAKYDNDRHIFFNERCY